MHGVVCARSLPSPLTVVHRDVGEHVVELDGDGAPGVGGGAGDSAAGCAVDRQHVGKSAARRWGGNYLPPPWDGPGLRPPGGPAVVEAEAEVDEQHENVETSDHLHAAAGFFLSFLECQVC